MIYIAHRGLFLGPDKQKENHPEQISLAIELGYDCEIDIRVIDNKFYLGHDSSDYEVDEYWLRSSKLWIHVKNKEALHWFYECQYWKYNYFWHENDQYTLTSKGFVWTHPNSELLTSSILVMPEHVDATLNNAIQAKCFAICSDFVQDIKHKRESI
jgi:hypothetical protein